MSASRNRWRTLRIASEGCAIAMQLKPVKAVKIKMKEKNVTFRHIALSSEMKDSGIYG